MWRVEMSSADAAVQLAVAVWSCGRGSGSRSGARQCETIQHETRVFNTQKNARRAGDAVGLADGLVVGDTDGLALGLVVGDAVGDAVGLTLGLACRGKAE